VKKVFYKDQNKKNYTLDMAYSCSLLLRLLISIHDSVSCLNSVTLPVVDISFCSCVLQH
jgi:hypothetical protein